MNIMGKICSFGAIAIAFALPTTPAHATHFPAITCQPKTAADAARIDYKETRIRNISTTNSATVICSIGQVDQGVAPSVLVNDRNTNAGNNFSCTFFYYVGNIMSTIGPIASTTNGFQAISSTQGGVGIQEAWAVECTIPKATGSATTQISTIDSVLGGYAY